MPSTHWPFILLNAYSRLLTLAPHGPRQRIPILVPPDLLSRPASRVRDHYEGNVYVQATGRGLWCRGFVRLTG
jgi:hypothetical protein